MPRKFMPIGRSVSAERGVRCWVSGKLTGEGSARIVATCDAQLVNLAALWAGQKGHGTMVTKWWWHAYAPVKVAAP